MDVITLAIAGCRGALVSACDTVELKVLANEDTLLRTHCCRHKCFPVYPCAQHLLRHKFCVRSKCFPVCAAWKHNIHFVSRPFAPPRNITSNNVSATMCPRLPVPLRQIIQIRSHFLGPNRSQKGKSQVG